MGNKASDPLIHSAIYIDCCNSTQEREQDITQDIYDGADVQKYITCCCFRLTRKMKNQPCDEIKQEVSNEHIKV